MNTTFSVFLVGYTVKTSVFYNITNRSGKIKAKQDRNREDRFCGAIYLLTRWVIAYIIFLHKVERSYAMIYADNAATTKMSGTAIHTMVSLMNET